MGEIKQDWLIQVESAVYSKNSHRPMPGPLTAARLVHIKIKLLLAESAIYTVLCQGLLLQPGQIK